MTLDRKVAYFDLALDGRQDDDIAEQSPVYRERKPVPADERAAFDACALGPRGEALNFSAAEAWKAFSANPV